MFVLGQVRYLEIRPVTLSASRGSGSPDEEILRCAQDDSHDTSQVRSREVLSPNVYRRHKIFDILHGTCYKIEYETETRLPVSNISD